MKLETVEVPIATFPVLNSVAVIPAFPVLKNFRSAVSDSMYDEKASVDR